MKRDEISRQVYSGLISLLLVVPAYLVLLQNAFSLKLNVILIFITLVIIFALGVALAFRPKIRVNKYFVIYLAINLIYLAISLNNIDKYGYSIFQWGFYFLIPLFVMQQDFIVEKVFRYTTILSIFAVFGINSILVITNYGLHQADMYSSYSLLPLIAGAFMHFLYYRHNSNAVIWIGYFLNVYYFVRLMQVSVRGIWAAIAVLVALLFCRFIQSKVQKKAYMVLLFAVLCVVLIVCMNLSYFLGLFVKFLDSMFGIEISIIVKMQQLAEAQNILNGRGRIWTMCLSYFLNSPIWGSGIMSVPILSNGTIMYPHNFILQLMVEGGVILAAVPVVVLVINLYRFIVTGFSDKDKGNMFILLMCVGITGNLFSGDCWKSAPLWLAISYCLSLICTRKQNIRRVYCE